MVKSFAGLNSNGRQSPIFFEIIVDKIDDYDIVLKHIGPCTVPVRGVYFQRK